MNLTDFANNLTTEQYINLLNFAYGPVPADIAAMTDDELLAELDGD